MKYLISTLFICNYCFAGTLFTDELKKQKVHFSKYNGVRVSTRECKTTCIAKKIIDNPPEISKIKLPKNNMKNPSSYLCQAYQGMASIYIDEKDNEYSICIFKDKSSFLTWDFIQSKD